MEVANSIRDKLAIAFNPSHVEISNESHMHAGPATDSHFKLVMVAEAFTDMTAVKRHQAVYKPPMVAGSSRQSSPAAATVP